MLDICLPVTTTEGALLWPLGKEGRFSSPPHSGPSSCFLQLYSKWMIFFLNKLLHLPDLSGGSNLTPIQDTVSTFLKLL